MAIQLIVTDLDNTLLRNDKTISSYTEDIFRQCHDAGIYTCVATARYITGIRKFSDIIHPDFEITNDGTMTFQNNKMLFGFPLPLDTANKILNSIQNTYPDSYISVVTPDGIIRKTGLNGHSSLPESELSSAVFTDHFDSLAKAPYKIVMECDSADFATSLARQYNCRLTVYRNENRYAFTASNAGKVDAISHLAKKLGISANEIAAFGDDYNDIEMLKYCATSVSVENSIPEVAEICHFHTLSNENDGVAYFIEHNILR